jgi:hypothetical protein
MNEVMCTAQDIGIKIFYQDTDSMHIGVDDIPRLADEFKNKFGRELIGGQTGQFHSDFEPISGSSDMPVSVESYFIGKKTYIDKLTNSSGGIAYHMRCKGVPQECLRTVIREQFEDKPMELYECLYNDLALTFDLCKNRVQFKFNKNLTIETMTDFKRRVQRNTNWGKEEIH